MKTGSNPDGMMNLVVVPSNSRRQMVEMQKANMYLRERQELRQLSQNEKLALDRLAHITGLEAMLSPYVLIDQARERFKEVASSLTSDFLEIIENKRLHLLFVLDVRWGDEEDLKSYINLNLYVKKHGKISVIGGENVKEAAAKLFMEVDSESRYLSPGAEVEFNLSERISDPGFIHAKTANDVSLDQLQQDREAEIAWLRRKLLNSLYSPNDPLKEMIDNIPVNLPALGERVNRYPISFLGREVTDRGWAKETSHPQGRVCELTGISVENLPPDIRNALRVKSMSASGRMGKNA